MKNNFDSDDQDLRDIEEAEKELKEDPELKAWAERDLDKGFDQLMDRLRGEQAGSGYGAGKTEAFSRKRTKEQRRLLVLVSAVCVLMVCASIHTVARNGYDYVVYPLQSERNYLLRYNSEARTEGDGLDDAYDTIARKLEIPVLMLNYLPEGMAFNSCEINGQTAVLRLDYKGNQVYLREGKAQLGNSVAVTEYDGKFGREVFNRWLGRDLTVNKNVLDDQTAEYSVRIENTETYYSLAGVMEEQEFVRMVEMLNYR